VLAPNQFVAFFKTQPAPGNLIAYNHTGGRLPGKINLNTINDVETFRALCDAQDANGFNPTVFTFAAALGAGSGFNTFTITGPSGSIVNGRTNGLDWAIAPGTLLEIRDPTFGNENVVVTGVAPVAGGSQVTFAPGLQLAHPPGTQITVDNVSMAFNNFISSRDGGLVGTTVHQPRPILPLSAGVVEHNVAAGRPSWQYPNARGFPYNAPTAVLGLSVDDTLLRRPLTIGTTVNTEPRLFEQGLPMTSHPYRRFEMLTKMFNNITNRSNTFAVFLTVGYFEVLQDLTGTAATNPYFGHYRLLGQEIGRADGRHKRHRMFAIVDRSTIASWVEKQNTDLQRFNPQYSYDVATGVKLSAPMIAPGPPPTPMPAPPALPATYNAPTPLLGNNVIDPRKSYLEAPGSVLNPYPFGNGPPPAVLHWSIIE
jgi:hypothetical protein